MASIRGMMACSLDGFAADAAGGVAWLDPFHGVDWGYDAFLAGIGTVVLGRRTYEQALTLAQDWPYTGRRGIVLGNISDTPPAGVSRWTGDLDGLVAQLRDRTDGDVWVVGGPTLRRR